MPKIEKKEKVYPNRLKEIRQRRGFTQEEVVEQLQESGYSISVQQYSRLERWERRINQDHLKYLPPILLCSPGDILAANDDSTPIVGYVGGGAEVHAIDDHPLGFGLGEADVPEYRIAGENGGHLDHVPCPTGYNPREVVAVRVRGDSMYPMAEDGWLIFYTRKFDGDVKKCVNKLCVVKVKDGAYLLKKLRAGRSFNRFNLESWNAPLREDVEIEWCGKVVEIRPV